MMRRLVGCLDDEEKATPMIALLIAAGVSMGVSLIGTRILVPWLRNRGVGQPIRLDGPQGHLTKAGTPTMGGVAIVARRCSATWLAHSL